MQRKFDTTIIMLSCALVALGGAAIVMYFTYHNFKDRMAIRMATDNLTSWHWDQETGDGGSVTIENGAVRCESIVTDGKPNSLYLYHHDIFVETGHRYHVVFVARADPPHKILFEANQGKYGGSTDSIGLDEACLLDQYWTKHEATFTAGKTGHIVNLPQFDLGGSTGTVWFKDVSVEEIK